MKNNDINTSLLGRYEGKDHIGITRYAVFETTSESDILCYSYGVQGMPPVDTKYFSYNTLAERVEAIIEKRMVKVLDTEDVQAEAVTNTFSLADWAGQ